MQSDKQKNSIRTVIALTEREGGRWIPYPLWVLDHNEKMPAAEMYDDGMIYDYALERLGRNRDKCWRYLKAAWGDLTWRQNNQKNSLKAKRMDEVTWQIKRDGDIVGYVDIAAASSAHAAIDFWRRYGRYCGQ